MNKQSHNRISIGSQEKIGATHLERLAYIYVRQSTPKQVTQNQESQMYQRRLASRAKTMGWHEKRIRIIDGDQAQSGKESTYREGFGEIGQRSIFGSCRDYLRL